MQAEIIAIGTELITGAAVDTNTAWISERLGRLGLVPARHVTIGDDRDAIAAAIREASSRAELLILTGGLGPTQDDMTRDALADVTGRPLELDESALAAIESFFRSIGRTMSESNRLQARFPRGGRSLPNEWGTAPGVSVTVGSATVFALPGVPREMMAMFGRYVEPFVAERCGQRGLAIRVLRTYGAGESNVAEQIADLMKPGRNPAVGTTASEGIISVRIVATGDSRESAARLAARDVETVRERLGVLVYGEDDDTLASAVGRLLTDRGRTVSTAESCTGGLLGRYLTDVPGSSAYYVGGLITYSNAQKIAALGVPSTLIASRGAVSEEVARAMAVGCVQRTGSDFALSVTGIAGPGGGSVEKPVGLVYIGLAGPMSVVVKKWHFSERLGRDAIRDRSAKAALNMLRRHLSDQY